jgi:hypothetical protein
MTPTAAENQTSAPIDETIELEFGTMLVAESEDGGYEPVAMVITIREARELADEDLQIRMSELEKGGQPMCPARYVVWARRDQGTYRTITTFEAD